MRSAAAAVRDGDGALAAKKTAARILSVGAFRPRLEGPICRRSSTTRCRSLGAKPPFLHVHPLESERLSVADSLGELQIVGRSGSLTRLDSKAKLPLCISWREAAAAESISSTLNCLSSNGSPGLLQGERNEARLRISRQPSFQLHRLRRRLLKSARLSSQEVEATAVRRCNTHVCRRLHVANGKTAERLLIFSCFPDMGLVAKFISR